jgi:outer membrane protein assembly factor BamB
MQHDSATPQSTRTKPRSLHRGAFIALVLIGALGMLWTASGPAETAALSDPPADPKVKMIVPGGEAMNYWSRWRGPSGQGIVEGGNYPDTWSDTENVLWKVGVPGRGHSSPIIWGNRIFLTSADAAGGNNRSILCFQRSDGKLLWKTVVPEAAAERLHRKNSYASSSVSTDGERIYGYFGNAGMVAVDFEGKLIWHTKLGTINLYHGPGGSPLLYKDRLILYQDQKLMGRNVKSDPGFIVALDKKTGRELWRNERDPKPGWGTPIAVQVDDRTEIIVSSSRRIESIDPETGEVFWFCGGNTFEVIPTPVVGHDMIYCCSGRAGPTIAVKPGGSNEVTDTHVVWKTPKGSSFVPSPLLLGDYLYTINDMVSVLTCHNAKNGELIDQLRLGEARREGFSASPVAVGNKVFFTNDMGETFVLNPAPDFKLLHVNRLGEQTLASPALVDDKWYFRTQNHLICIGNADEDSASARGN